MDMRWLLAYCLSKTLLVNIDHSSRMVYLQESNGALIDIGRTLTYEESELSTDIIIDVFGLTGDDAGGGVADRRGA